jgi:GAF domain-containing protein
MLNRPSGTLLDLSDVQPGHIAALEGRTIHIPDRSSPEFRARFPTASYGPFATLQVPLLAHTGSIGNISVGRDVAGPYSPREISLLETFADQAVIAIENARLFSELEQRTSDLTQSLEQQTALAEVLRIIAASPTDLPTVLDGIVSASLRLLDVEHTHLSLSHEDVLVSTATAIADDLEPSRRERFLETVRLARPAVLDRRSMRGSAFLDAHTIEHVNHDWSVPAEYPDFSLATIMGPCALAFTPLMRQGKPVGVLGAMRLRPEPFTRRQIELLETFANQAVIAIENARLFEELEQRNAELQESNRQVTEALEQQTATAEVLLQRLGTNRSYSCPRCHHGKCRAPLRRSECRPSTRR